MRRVFLIALGIGLLILAAGFLWIGAFPPKIAPHEVTHVIPNNSFIPHEPAPVIPEPAVPAPAVPAPAAPPHA